MKQFINRYLSKLQKPKLKKRIKETNITSQDIRMESTAFYTKLSSKDGFHLANTISFAIQGGDIFETYLWAGAGKGWSTWLGSSAPRYSPVTKEAAAEAVWRWTETRCTRKSLARSVPKLHPGCWQLYSRLPGCFFVDNTCLRRFSWLWKTIKCYMMQEEWVITPLCGNGNIWKMSFFLNLYTVKQVWKRNN